MLVISVDVGPLSVVCAEWRMGSQCASNEQFMATRVLNGDSLRSDRTVALESMGGGAGMRVTGRVEANGRMVAVAMGARVDANGKLDIDVQQDE